MADMPIASYVMTPCAWTVPLVLARMSVIPVMISLLVHHLVSALAPIPAKVSWNGASIAQASARHAKLTTLLTMI